MEFNFPRNGFIYVPIDLMLQDPLTKIIHQGSVIIRSVHGVSFEYLRALIFIDVAMFILLYPLMDLYFVVKFYG